MKRIMIFVNCVVLLSIGIVTMSLMTNAAVAEKDVVAGGNGAEELPLPIIPADLITPADRADYLISHFWDSMDFSDTVRSRSASFMEQNFVNFASVFVVSRIDSVLPDVARSVMSRAKVDREAYCLLAETADKYLYEVNSPMLNEGAYVPFLRAILDDDFIEDVLRARYENQYEECMKNRVGVVATDFSMELRDGSATSLRECVSVGGALANLLLFYDPDCGGCAEVIKMMSENKDFCEAVSCGKIRVMAVYPYGDMELWQSSAGHVPVEWIDGMSVGGAIIDEELYSVRVVPSLYLLDGNSVVLMKDADVQKAVESALSIAGCE